MLDSVVRPVSWSVGKPVRGVRPVSAYTPYKHLAQLLGRIQSEGEEEKPSDRHEPTPRESISWVEDALGSSDASRLELILDDEHQQWVRFFLTPHHEEILSIRSRFRRGDLSYRNGNSFRELPILHSESLEATRSANGVSHRERDQLYQVQMQLYETKKGLHCHLIV